MNQEKVNEFVNNGKKVTYERFGKEQAQKSNCSPEQLPFSLDIIYQAVVEEARLDEKGRNNKIEALRKEVEDLIKQKQIVVAEQEKLKDEVEDWQKEIINIENNKTTSDFLPFVIGAFITILLFFFLWAFYAASGYAALNGVKQGSRGFAGIFSALSEAINKGGFLMILTFLFPTIFLGLGFLIHDALDKKKYGFITVLLLFTFCLDAIIGYKIAENIHVNAYNAGEVNNQWQFDMINSDLNFYMVMACGFVCYVMWGFLLNYTLNKWKEIQPDKMISKLKQKIREANAEIQRLTATINNCQTSLEKKENDLMRYMDGTFIDIDWSQLDSYIGQFMSGWNSNITYWYGEQSATLIEAGKAKKESWIVTKKNQPSAN